jgi:hypothetical protein
LLEGGSLLQRRAADAATDNRVVSALVLPSMADVAVAGAAL